MRDVLDQVWGLEVRPSTSGVMSGLSSSVILCCCCCCFLMVVVVLLFEKGGVGEVGIEMGDI